MPPFGKKKMLKQIWTAAGKGLGFCKTSQKEMIWTVAY
jgi:hypothetical protein